MNRILTERFRQTQERVKELEPKVESLGRENKELEAKNILKTSYTDRNARRFRYAMASLIREGLWEEYEKWESEVPYEVKENIITMQSEVGQNSLNN